MIKYISFFFFYLFTISSIFCRNIYIDPNFGSDINDGSLMPYKTIKYGLNNVKPGDTIHLAPTVFNEVIEIKNLSGEKGKPIVIDGHGAIIDGSVPINSLSWNKLAPGLYCNSDIINKIDINRWFVIFNGKIERMGRTSKGQKKPFLNVVNLKPNKWTYDESNKTVFVKIDSTKNINECNIRVPIMYSGVLFLGACHHFVIKNLTTTHVFNDGFNIHGDINGDAEDLYFENIKAIECGDDGFSAHEKCQVIINGFQSIANATGICNVGESRSINKNVIIKNCIAYDLYLTDSGSHIFSNCFISSSAENTCVFTHWVDHRMKGIYNGCHIRFEKVIIKRDFGCGDIKVQGDSTSLTINDSKFYGINLFIRNGFVKMSNSYLGGNGFQNIELNVLNKLSWSAQNNHYLIHKITIQESVYYMNQFSNYKFNTKQDLSSEWHIN